MCPALSGSLRLSQALYCSTNLLAKPLFGSQGPCWARGVATAPQLLSSPELNDNLISSTTQCMLCGAVYNLVHCV